MKNNMHDGIITCVDCGETAHYECADNDQDIIQQTGFYLDSEEANTWRCPACQEYIENKHDIIEFEQDHQDEIY